MAKFSDVFAKQAEPSNIPKAKAPKIRNIHYSKLVTSSYQYRNRGEDVVQRQADLLKADGEILEPCIVRKISPSGDTFEVVAGHKRILAAKYLVEEEQLEQFAFIPCIEKTLSDVRANFAVYSTNSHDEKTPYETMREIEGMYRLLKEHPEEFPEFAGKGRLVEKLADQLHLSRSVISDYQNISHNLGEKGMESFAKGEIDKSAAVTLAAVPEEQQEEILENGLKTRKEIKIYLQKQVKEPDQDKIINLYQKMIKDEFPVLSPKDLAEELKECWGKLHMCCTYEDECMECSPRGIRLPGCDEITWNRLASLLEEYLPESEFFPPDTGEPMEELQSENFAEDASLEGQMSVADFPDLLPPEELHESESNESQEAAQEEIKAEHRETETASASEASEVPSQETTETYNYQDVKKLCEEAIFELKEYRKVNDTSLGERIPEETMKKKRIYVDALQALVDRMEEITR